MTRDTAAALAAPRAEDATRPTPGQTVGPFFAFGLELPQDARGRLPALARRDRARRHRATTARARRSPTRSSRSGGADSRRHRAARARRPPARRPHLHRVRPVVHDRRGPLRVLDPQPGLGRRRSAVLRRDRLRARSARQAAHPHLPARRTKTRSPRTRCWPPSTPDERATLIATRTPDGGLHHDIRLQGEKETVFLAF